MGFEKKKIVMLSAGGEMEPLPRDPYSRLCLTGAQNQMDTRIRPNGTTHLADF